MLKLNVLGPQLLVLDRRVQLRLVPRGRFVALVTFFFLSDDFCPFQASQNGLDLLEKMAQSQIYSQEQLADVCRVFETATRMEAAFFKQSVAVVQSQMPVQ